MTGSYVTYKLLNNKYRNSITINNIYYTTRHKFQTACLCAIVGIFADRVVLVMSRIDLRCMESRQLQVVGGALLHIFEQYFNDILTFQLTIREYRE